MWFPTHATLPQDATSQSQQLTAGEATATPTKNWPSFQYQPENFATITTKNTGSSSGRRIAWQTPNVVMDGIPTTLVTVTRTIYYTPQSTPPALVPTINTGALNTFATTQPTVIPATGTPPGRPLLEPAEYVLPDWTPMMTIFLLSWVVMAWILVVIIFFATFPEKVAWLDELKISRQKDRHGRKSSMNQARHATTRERDTAAVATGLGISLGEPPNTPRLRKPHSFDFSSHEVRGPRPNASVVSTAPLPSNRNFVALSPPKNSPRDDLESGESEIEIQMKPISEQPRRPEDYGISAVLRSVNAVIEFIADGLARTATDRITNGAEQGLLLPMREDERQPMVVDWGEC